MLESALNTGIDLAEVYKILQETSKFYKGSPMPITGYELLSEDENKRYFVRYNLSWGPSESLIITFESKTRTFSKGAGLI